MTNQPYYMIEFTAVSCLFEIRVNDNPIITMELKGQISTRIPINFAISLSGKQEISSKMLPISGNTDLSPGAQLDYHVQLYDVSSNDFDLKEQFEDYKSPKIEEDKPIPLQTNSSTFDAEIPYQLRDFWKEGEDLKDIDDLNEKLRISYNSIGEIIKKKKFDLYIQKIADREYNMATSMYLTPEEARGRIKRLIRDLDNGYDHVEFPNDAVMVFSAYGKKVSLKRMNGDPALSFVNKEKKEQVMLDLEFYWSKETNRLEII